MDELLTLRELVADVPTRDTAAEAEVWRRIARPPRRSRHRLVLGATVVAVTACAALALTLRDSSVGVQPAEAACVRTASVERCTQALANAAREGSAVPAIAYQRLVAYSGPLLARGYVVQNAQTVERWIERDDPRGAERASEGRLFFSTRAGHAAWVRAGSPSWRSLAGAPLPARRIRQVRDTNALTNCNYRKVASEVPTDAAGVETLLRSIAPRHYPGSWGTYFYRLCLPNPLLTGAQRAAIFEALGRSRSAHVLGRMRDPLGRAGVSLASTIKGETLVTLYAPKTGRVLADGLRIRSSYGGRFFWWHLYTVDGAPARGLFARPG